MLDASDEATFGSVMRKAERILPSSSGSHHCLMCSEEPYLSSVSMLPVSGAAHLTPSGAQCTRPIFSQGGAYARLVGVPPWAFDRHRFHRPAWRAVAFSSSITGTGSQRFSLRTCASHLCSLGWTCWFMNPMSCLRSSWTLGE